MKLFLAPAVFAICLIAIASSRGDEEKIKPEALPKAVAASLNARFPGAEITGAVKEMHKSGYVDERWKKWFGAPMLHDPRTGPTYK